MNDKMREEFEEWLKDEWPGMYAMYLLGGDDLSDEITNSINSSWVGWQAATIAAEKRSADRIAELEIFLDAALADLQFAATTNAVNCNEQEK